mmetsp:Transcript_12641/g.19587  ORF Transcript_12641/g.19587 Transcript_12641/m.19587 type:complete len:116 (-) Transcript_12641:92-439(-)
MNNDTCTYTTPHDGVSISPELYPPSSKILDVSYSRGSSSSSISGGTPESVMTGISYFVNHHQHHCTSLPSSDNGGSSSSSMLQQNVSVMKNTIQDSDDDDGQDDINSAYHNVSAV